MSNQHTENSADSGQSDSNAGLGRGLPRELNQFDTNMTFFKFLLKCRDTILIREVMRLKFDNLRLQLSIFRFEVLHIGTYLRLSRLELHMKYRRWFVGFLLRHSDFLSRFGVRVEVLDVAIKMPNVPVEPP